jgi:glycosyltransferase involved in cell wall biosynthesis
MRFTLFTPVFNRADSLNRVWESINRQTCRDFEWICVDDGSSDDSYARLQQYAAHASFPVTVLRNDKNQGKHVAWNRAVAASQGELFVPCDSDDEFDNDALEFFWRHWSALSDAERAQASGINVLCRLAGSQQISGTAFPKSPMWSNNLELSYTWGVTGEKWGCIRTDILKARPFPTIKGYYPEGYLWYSIARSYQVLCINKVLRTYYADQSNRVSSRIPQVGRMPAAYDYTSWHVRNNWDYLRQNRREALREGSNVYVFGFFLHDTLPEINAKLAGAPARKIWPLLCLVGWLRYRRLKKQCAQ